MRLYNFRHSPNPLKVRLALAEIGAAYETVDVDLFKGDQRSNEFHQINPMGQVPVLVDGELTLRESNAILAYLGREYGRRRWPSDIKEECRALQWLFFESSQLVTNAGKLWWSDTIAPKVGRDPYSEDSLKDAVRGLERSLDALEAHFKESQWVLGEEFSLVDCSIGTTLSMLTLTRLAKGERWPHVMGYTRNLKLRDSWRKADGEAIYLL